MTSTLAASGLPPANAWLIWGVINLVISMVFYAIYRDGPIGGLFNLVIGVVFIGMWLGGVPA